MSKNKFRAEREMEWDIDRTYDELDPPPSLCVVESYTYTNERRSRRQILLDWFGDAFDIELTEIRFIVDGKPEFLSKESDRDYIVDLYEPGTQKLVGRFIAVA